jgi:hypothetical protein
MFSMLQIRQKAKLLLPLKNKKVPLGIDPGGLVFLRFFIYLSAHLKITSNSHLI